MNHKRLIDLPLGSRFKYLLDPSRSYVLLDKSGAGMVETAGPSGLRGVYAAASSPEALGSIRVVEA